MESQKQNSDVLVTSILGTIPPTTHTHAFCLPSPLVKCELIMFPFWLQPQTALISCPGLHLPSTDLCQPLLRCSSLLSNSQMLLGSHLADEHTLLKSYLFPLQFCLWPLLFFCGPTFTAHMCDMVTKITTGSRMKGPLLQSFWKLDQVWCIYYEKRFVHSKGCKIRYRTRHLGSFTLRVT